MEKIYKYIKNGNFCCGIYGFVSFRECISNAHFSLVISDMAIFDLEMPRSSWNRSFVNHHEDSAEKIHPDPSTSMTCEFLYRMYRIYRRVVLLFLGGGIQIGK